MAELKTFSELAAEIELQRRDDAANARQERIELKHKRQDRAVVGGVYCPEPIDREAAMLLARAPWWAFAPSVKNDKKQERGTMEPKKHKCGLERPVSTVANEIKKTSKDLGCSAEQLLNQEGLPMALAEYSKNKHQARLIELEPIMRATSEACISQAKVLCRSIEELEESIKDAKRMVQISRMTIVSDCVGMVSALKDVRQFFLGPDYDSEQKRLSEFVDLCERLKVLKDSGFLDTVADTMIKLASD